MFPLVISCFLHRNVQGNDTIDGRTGALTAADRFNHNIVRGTGAAGLPATNGIRICYDADNNSPALDLASEWIRSVSVRSASSA
jgi:hypothetical protein